MNNPRTNQALEASRAAVEAAGGEIHELHMADSGPWGDAHDEAIRCLAAADDALLDEIAAAEDRLHRLLHAREMEHWWREFIVRFLGGCAQALGIVTIGFAAYYLFTSGI